jgi:hypothetical protein
MSLSNFIQKKDSMPVMLPPVKIPFRVHQEEVLENVLLHYNNDRKRWYLVDNDLAEEQALLTKSSNGFPNVWSIELEKMIRIAKNEWTIRYKDGDSAEFDTCDIGKTPKWHKKNVIECVELAFQGRMIETLDEAQRSIKSAAPRQRRIVIEE